MGTLRTPVLRRKRMHATIGRMYAIRDILRLANRYATARQIATSTLAREATGSSTWFDRCVTGRVTIRSAISVVQWLSDHWPKGLEWPADIARPESVPDSVAAVFMGSSAPPDDLLGAVKEAKRRMFAAVQRGDWHAARARRERNAGRGNAPRSVRTGRLAGCALPGAGRSALRLRRRGSPVPRRNRRRTMAPDGELLRPCIDRAHFGGRRTLRLAMGKEGGMSTYEILITRNFRPGPAGIPGWRESWDRALPACGWPKARRGPRGQDARAPGNTVVPT